MSIRKANLNEAKDILNFYKNVLKHIKGTEFNPKWNDSYPNLEFIQKSIEKEELYICIINDEIVSSFILNHEFDNDYSSIKWQIDAKLNEITVIHTFAINPNQMGKGYATKIFNKIKKICKLNNQKTLRIDIIDGNIGAQNVFKYIGFEYIDNIEITHYAVGLDKFHVYEYLL